MKTAVKMLASLSISSWMVKLDQSVKYWMYLSCVYSTCVPAYGKNRCLQRRNEMFFKAENSAD